MVYTVKCIPSRINYFSYTNGFKILSCNVLEAPEGFSYNQTYGNFSLVGRNLSTIELNKPVTLEIEQNANAKYPNSYSLIGYNGINYTKEQIQLSETGEMNILQSLMTENQAESVHKSYPHFVEMVVNGQEQEIDAKNIYGVGEILLKKYFNKIKERTRLVKFVPVLSEMKLLDVIDSASVGAIYSSPELFKKELESNPYKVLDGLKVGFAKADIYVKTNMNKVLLESEARCVYAVKHLLVQNEELGHTKMDANLLAYVFKSEYPECYKYLVKVVKDIEKKYNGIFRFYEKNKSIALTHTWLCEKEIADYIKQQANNKPNYDWDVEQYGFIDGVKFTDEQMSALNCCVKNGSFLLMGSAGVGKTSVTKAIVRMLEDNNQSYLLLAPTGIAAKRLREATGRPSRTIHKYLMSCGLNNLPHTDEDFVIVDESSMVGVNLLAELISTFDKQKIPRLIMVCDNAQLVSISSGNCIQDLVESNSIPVVRLTKIFRYNSSGIVTVVTDTRFGENKNLKGTYSDYHFFNIESNNAMNLVEQLYKKALNNYNKEDIMILSPYNKGGYGTKIINELIQNKFNKNDFINLFPKFPFKIGDRVLNNKNLYAANKATLNDNGQWEIVENEAIVMNGDIGFIVGIYDSNLLVNFGDMVIAYSEDKLKCLQLGYAISCHKSQGSEAPVVIVLADKSHERLLTRNLLYVALSRAKKELYLISSEGVFTQALLRQENKERETNLKDMLLEKEN